MARRPRRPLPVAAPSGLFRNPLRCSAASNGVRRGASTKPFPPLTSGSYESRNARRSRGARKKRSWDAVWLAEHWRVRAKRPRRGRGMDAARLPRAQGCAVGGPRPNPKRAGDPAVGGARRSAAFLWLLSFARAKKVTRRAGPRPRLLDNRAKRTDDHPEAQAQSNVPHRNGP
jgi:hypothetical protein